MPTPPFQFPSPRPRGRALLLRLTLLLVAVAALALGLLVEKHAVYSFSADTPATLPGTAFIQGATVDSFISREGRLFDIYSLSPGTAKEKDCKT